MPAQAGMTAGTGWLYGIVNYSRDYRNTLQKLSQNRVFGRRTVVAWNRTSFNVPNMSVGSR